MTERRHILLGSHPLPVANKQEEEKKLVEALGPREVEGVFKMPLNPDGINMRTYARQEAIERLTKGMARYQLDVERDRRLTAGMCPYCFYLRGPVVATANMPRHPCKRWGCHGFTSWSSGDCPEYCQQCSSDLGICRRCAADLDYTNRKTMKPPKRKQRR